MINAQRKTSIKVTVNVIVNDVNAGIGSKMCKTVVVLRFKSI